MSIGDRLAIARVLVQAACMAKASPEDAACLQLVDVLQRSESLRELWFDLWFDRVPDALQGELVAEFTGHQGGRARPDTSG